jgi:protein-S-isoprenylcysteine O-methyltransferase Ste14
VTVDNDGEMNDKGPSGPAGASGRVKDSPGVIALPPVLYLGTLLVGLLIHFFETVPLSTTPWIRLAGVVILASGILLARWGRRTMVTAGTNVIPNKPTLAIVTEGPFRYTRNPLYTGATLAYIGLALVFNSFWPLALLPPLLVVVHWGVVRREERYLEAKFGTQDLVYKESVRRWI